MSFQTTQSGIIIPQGKRPVGVECGYCPYIIFKQNEAGGRLFLHKEKPICAKCRILKGSRHANHIRHDKDKFDTDVKARETLKDNNEIERVAKIAVASQKNAERISDKI